jgi:hypothetical protein
MSRGSPESPGIAPPRIASTMSGASGVRCRGRPRTPPRRRGRGCRLFLVRHPQLMWVLIRHGQPMRREASQRGDGAAATEVDRPQRHDVLLYDEWTGEIAAHATTKRERTLYLRTPGLHTLSDAAHFRPAERFTLDPPVALGPAALEAADIDGIATVRLVEAGATGVARGSCRRSAGARTCSPRAARGVPAAAWPVIEQQAAAKAEEQDE